MECGTAADRHRGLEAEFPWTRFPKAHWREVSVGCGGNEEYVTYMSRVLRNQYQRSIQKTAKPFLKKNKVGRLALPGISICYKALIVKAVWVGSGMDKLTSEIELRA